MNQFLQEAMAMREEISANRRWLHLHPETGHDLDGTVAFVKSRLTGIGCEPKDIGDHGVTCVLGKKEGRCILIRADMDALPMREESGEPFSASGDKMHACGHDMHTSMLLAAAKILKAHESELNGQIKLLFQPAEETLTGAQNMVDAGILENPKVDAAIALHVDAGCPFKAGMLTFHRPGVASASCDRYIINIRGKGGHGASPHDAVDPINVGAHIHLALQEIISREIPAQQFAVLTQGVFRSGDAPNIIPDTAVLEGTLRCYDNDLRRFILKRMEQIVTGTAQTFRAQAELVVTGGCAPVYNDSAVFDAAMRYIAEIDGPDWVYADGEVSPASEDFSNILDRVPGVFFFVSAGDKADGYQYSMHNPKVVFDERALPRGASALAWAAKRWLDDNGAC